MANDDREPEPPELDEVEPEAIVPAPPRPPRPPRAAARSGDPAPPPPPRRGPASVPPPPRRPAAAPVVPAVRRPAEPGSDPRATAGAPPPPPPRQDPAEHLPTRIGVAPPPDPRVALTRAAIGRLEAALAKAKEPARRGRVHYEIARLLESPLGQLDAAFDHYQKSRQSCPDHVPAIRGSRRVALAKKEYAAALALFDEEVRLTGEPNARALLLYEKGRLLEDRMGLRREAHQAYSSALELEPTLATILKAVERVDIANESWDDLDKTYQFAANSATGDTKLRAAIIASRARLAETVKSDAHGASELYREALLFDQRAPGAIEALKRLFTTSRRYRDLAETLQLEAELAQDPVVRSLALYRTGRVLADRLGHVDESISAFEQAVSAAPDETLVLEELARLYEVSKRWEDLVKTLERIAARAENVPSKVGYFHRIAQICEDRLGDEGRASTWLRRALELDPTFLPGLAALGKLLTRHKDWQSLIAMHLGEANASRDSARRAAAHSRVAVIAEEQLGDTEQAMLHHSRALGLAPMLPMSFKALTRLLAAAGKHRELLELYERAVDSAPDADTRVTYLFKIGRTFEDVLSSPTQALSAYRRILEVEPKHLGALHAAERAAERAGRFKDLVLLLDREAEVVTDAGQVVALWHRAGEILEDQLSDEEAALARYQKVLSKNPRYAPALASLGRLYYRSSRWEELLGVYKLELDLAPKGPDASALLYKMGELSEERIGKDDEAIALYRRAIDMDPFNTAALHALGRKLAERNLWAELVKLLELELSGLKNAAEQARTGFRLGEVYESRLNQSDKALSAYELALTREPDFRPALDGRARLLSSSRDFKRLAEELEREATTINTDPQVALATLYRLGELFRDHLDDTPRAIECFEAVLARDPAHIGALRALEPLYAEVGHWEGLAQDYTLQARVLGDVGAKVAALKELARLQEHRLGAGLDVQRATYISILQLVPSDPGALAALERIALELGDAQLLTHVDAKLGALSAVALVQSAHQTRLAETLEAVGDASAAETYRSALARDPENLGAAQGIIRLAEQSRDAGRLTEAADLAARVLDDASEAARLLGLAADVHAGTGDAAGAVSCLERALELDPNDARAALELERLLLALGEVDRLFDVLCQAAQWATDLERRAGLWITVARVLAEQKHDVPAGLAALHRVIDEQPGHVETLMALAGLYSRDGQWAEAVDRLNQALRQGPSREIQVAAHVELARILHDHLGDELRARASLDRVMALDPKNRAALLRLLRIQHQRGEAAEAAETAARLVAVAIDDQERAEALSELASLHRELKAPDRAAHSYEQAISLVGLDGRAAKEFRDLLQEQKLLGDDPPYALYVNALMAHLQLPRLTDPVRVEILAEISRVQADEMGRMDHAVATLDRALAKAPGSIELRELLVDRLRGAGQHERALSELRRLLDKDVTRVQSWRDLAHTFRALGRAEEADTALAAVVALGAGNDLELSTVASRPSRCARAHPGAFDPVVLRGIDPVGPSDPTADLIATLVEVLGKMHPPELERYGLSTRDRLTSRAAVPIRQLAERVGRVVGVGEFDLYVHRAHAGSIEIELTDPPALMIPATVTQLPEPSQVFLLARALINVARGLHVVGRLSPREIEFLVIAAVRGVDPSFGLGSADEEFLNGHARRLQKAQSRRGRRAAEEAIMPLLGAPRIEFDAWSERVRRTAARASVVVADDLPGVVTLLRRTEGDLAGLRGQALTQGMDLVADLMRFSVSDAGHALRRRLGYA